MLPHHPPPDKTLLRIRADDPSWASGLPPVPPGAEVTVTVSHPDLVSEEELEARGYLFAGVIRPPLLPAGVEAADVVVTDDAVSPAFRAALRLAATWAFSPAFGPVGAVLAPSFRQHCLRRRAGPQGPRE